MSPDPSCPGTQAGIFDAAKYEFVNLSTAQVIADLRIIIKRLKALNPKIRFLLTVSPVPLTATASQKHVLTATTYSKAVLRAAAGEIADEFEYVDYFPSFEIISSPAFGGIFFDKNKRTIRKQGVDFVMQSFFRDFCTTMPERNLQPNDRGKTSDSLEGSSIAAKSYLHESDDTTISDVCDEQILEFYAR